MSKHFTLVKQIQDTLQNKLCIGESKHLAKADHTAQNGIYAYSTFRTYMKHANYFAQYCKEKHGCKTLEQCRPYIDEWLSSRSRLSPYTQKLEAASLAKLYGCSTKNFVQTDTRNRDNITRSRGEKVRDSHFSEANHRDLVDFCRSTGLRRGELECLRGDSLTYKDGKAYIHITSGAKGGRERFAPIIGDVAKVESMMKAAGSGKVFEKVPNGADIHGYRSDYATAIYKQHARSYEACCKTRFWNREHFNGKGQSKGGFDNDSVYRMRGSHKGEWLDKEAMRIASEALGHNRISVVGEHYIR